MGRTFSMAWRSDGTVKLSKHAPEALQELAKAGHLNQAPLELVRKTRNALVKKFKKAPEGKNSNNKYNVKAGQVWEDLDPRSVSSDGVTRKVHVLEVGLTHALVRSSIRNTKAQIELKRFDGKTKKGFKLHDDPWAHETAS